MGNPMKTLSLTEAKAHLSGLVDEISEADQEIVITPVPNHLSRDRRTAA